MTVYYSREHAWVAVEGDQGTVGITEFAQIQLGEIVFVELVEPGTQLVQNEDAGAGQSVAGPTTFSVFSPVSGAVTEVNQALADDPELASQDPEGKGWFFRLSLSDQSELAWLMDAAAYKSFCDSPWSGEPSLFRHSRESGNPDGV